jgi:hypothetical protein
LFLRRRKICGAALDRQTIGRAAGSVNALQIAIAPAITPAT